MKKARKSKRLSKANRKAWWRSLTPEEQADYRYRILEAEGRNPNWDEIYSQVVKEGNYLK